MLSLEAQSEHLLSFILELMQMQNQVLLKNGQLRSADLLRHSRWHIVVAVTKKALVSLENAETVQAMLSWERNGVVAFVVHAIDTLSSRLHSIAYREGAFQHQTEIEHALAEILRLSVEHIMAAFRVSAPSDEALVETFTVHFLLPLFAGSLKRYPPLVEVLFDSIKGIFDITQVSKKTKVDIAVDFLRALKKKTPSVFDIPKDGIVPPYCGIKETDNDAVFHILLRLEHPRDNPSFYVKHVLDELREQQRDLLWTYFNDPEYLCAQLLNDEGSGNGAVFVKILTELPDSPRARFPFVKVLLDHPKINDSIAAALYPLLDVSDAPSRELLQKNTYTRLFTDRHRAYQHLMIATWAHGPKEYILTMRFLIPRIRNEIPPDAQLIPEILFKNSADDILHLWDQATDDEASEMAELYLAWEKQNDEAVSRVRILRLLSV